MLCYFYLYIIFVNHCLIYYLTSLLLCLNRTHTHFALLSFVLLIVVVVSRPSAANKVIRHKRTSTIAHNITFHIHTMYIHNTLAHTCTSVHWTNSTHACSLTHTLAHTLARERTHARTHRTRTRAQPFRRPFRARENLTANGAAVFLSSFRLSINRTHAPLRPSRPVRIYFVNSALRYI